MLRNWRVDGLINGVHVHIFVGSRKETLLIVLSDSVLAVPFVAFKFHGPSAVVQLLHHYAGADPEIFVSG